MVFLCDTHASAVNKAVLMCVLERVRYGKHEIRRVVRGNPLAAKQILERLAIHILQDEKLVAVGVAQHGVDRHDSRVAELGCRSSLAQQVAATGHAIVRVATKNLEGHRPRKPAFRTHEAGGT